MKISIAKDRVLKALMENQSLSALNIHRHTITAALVELADEKFITIIETTVSGSGKVRTYAFQSLLPKGAHFYSTNQSFRKKAIWKWIEEAPKKYWFIPIILGALGVIIKEAIKYLSK